MKFLVVGGAGFIGSHTVELLLQRDDVEQVVVFDNFERGGRRNLATVADDPRLKVVVGDIMNYQEVHEVCEGMDGVFLLAALWLLECVKHPFSGCKVNVLGNLNVVDVVRELGIDRLVFASSASVYGNAVEAIMTEDHPLNNRTLYGATKIALEQILRAYHDLHGLSYAALRYFNVYGPRQDAEGAYVGVIMKVLNRIAAGERPIVYGTGEQAYDFVYVKDIARANAAAMYEKAVGEFNVATGLATQINDLISVLLELYGSTLLPEYEPAGVSGVQHRLGSTLRTRMQLGFQADTVLRDGLAEHVAWYKAQPS